MILFFPNEPPHPGEAPEGEGTWGLPGGGARAVPSIVERPWDGQISRMWGKPSFSPAGSAPPASPSSLELFCAVFHCRDAARSP